MEELEGHEQESQSAVAFAGLDLSNLTLEQMQAQEAKIRGDTKWYKRYNAKLLDLLNQEISGLLVSMLSSSLSCFTIRIEKER